MADEEKTTEPETWVDEQLAPNAVGVSEALPLVAWMVRGMLGASNLLMGMTAQNHAVPEYWCRAVRQLGIRLVHWAEDHGDKQGYKVN